MATFLSASHWPIELSKLINLEADEYNHLLATVAGKEKGGRSGRTRREIQMHDKETQVSKDLTRGTSKRK